ITVDKSSGASRNHIIVTGTYQGQTGTGMLDFGGITQKTNDPTGSAIFVAVYDTLGNPVFVNSYGGEFGASDVGNAVAVDSFGNIVAMGNVQSAVDFGGGFTFGDGAQNYFAVGITPGGTWRWNTRVVGTGGGL